MRCRIQRINRNKLKYRIGQKLWENPIYRGDSKKYKEFSFLSLSIFISHTKSLNDVGHINNTTRFVNAAGDTTTTRRFS